MLVFHYAETRTDGDIGHKCVNLRIIFKMYFWNLLCIKVSLSRYSVSKITIRMDISQDVN